jgi:hypothetical protein
MMFHARTWLNTLHLVGTLARVLAARWLLSALTDVAAILALGAGLVGLVIWRLLSRLGSVN